MTSASGDTRSLKGTGWTWWLPGRPRPSLQSAVASGATIHRRCIPRGLAATWPLVVSSLRLLPELHARPEKTGSDRGKEITQAVSQGSRSQGEGCLGESQDFRVWTVQGPFGIHSPVCLSGGVGMQERRMDPVRSGQERRALANWLVTELHFPLKLCF